MSAKTELRLRAPAIRRAGEPSLLFEHGKTEVHLSGDPEVAEMSCFHALCQSCDSTFRLVPLLRPGGRLILFDTFHSTARTFWGP